MMKNLSVFHKIEFIVLTRLFYARRFYHIGRRSRIFCPMQFSDTGSVWIGDYTFIAHYAWLNGNVDAPEPTVRIGSRVQIGHFAHIVGFYSVVIEDDVLIADKVYISDITHNYEDASVPVLSQGIRHIGDVRIGKGSWIGENVCLMGAKIGKHCVIGANSVVTKDIPDFCVAAGAPARVIRRYNVRSRTWERVRDG